MNPFKRIITIVASAVGLTAAVDTDNDRIQLFDGSGKHLATLPTLGAGLAVGPAGRFVLASRGNDRIRVLNRQGAELAAWGSSGTSPGAFRTPYDIALDGHGTVYVTDLGNHRVQYFRETGEFLGEWGRFGEGPGQFQYPQGLAVDVEGNVYVADDPSGNIYVADTNNHRIQKFSALRGATGR